MAKKKKNVFEKMWDAATKSAKNAFSSPSSNEKKSTPKKSSSSGGKITATTPAARSTGAGVKPSSKSSSGSGSSSSNFFKSARSAMRQSESNRQKMYDRAQTDTARRTSTAMRRASSSTDRLMDAASSYVRRNATTGNNYERKTPQVGNYERNKAGVQERFYGTANKLTTARPEWRSTSENTGYYSQGFGRKYYVKDVNAKDGWRSVDYSDYDKKLKETDKFAEKHRRQLMEGQNLTLEQRKKLREQGDWEHYTPGERALDTIEGSAQSHLQNINYALQNNNSVEHRTMASVEQAADDVAVRNAKMSGGEDAAKALRKKLDEQRQTERSQRWSEQYERLQKIDESATRGEKKMQLASSLTGGGQKLAYETLGAMTGMGIDIGVGALTGGGAIPSMVVSAAGGSERQANRDEFGRDKTLLAMQEGGVEAAERQQEINRRYGAVSGAVEGLSEKIFSIGAPMQKLVGKGAISGDRIVGSFARQVARSKAGENLINAFGKMGMSMTGEGLEEVVAGVLNPIAEKMIVNKDKDLDWGQIAKDSFHDAMIGGVIGGLFGGAEVVNQYQQGAFIKANTVDDEQIKAGLKSDEKSEAYQLASALQEHVEKGGEVNEYDARALEESLQQTYAQERSKIVNAERKADKDLSNEFGEAAVRKHYENPVAETYEIWKSQVEDLSEEEKEDKTAEIERGMSNVGMVHKYSDTVDDATVRMQNKLFGKEADVENEERTLSDDNKKVVRAIANIAVGEGTMADFAMFPEVDPIARETIQETLGIELPEGNEATRDALIALNVQNRRTAIEAGVNETVIGDAMIRLGEEGYNEFTKAMQGSNVSSDDFAKAYNVYEFFYDAGADGRVPFDKVPVPGMAEGVVDTKFMEAAYRAGSRSVRSEEGSEKQTTQEKNEKNVRKAKKKREGKFEDRTTQEYKDSLSESEKEKFDKTAEVLKALAKAWKVNIHFINAKDGVNGYYTQGTIYINASLEDPILETFTHEFTHHLETHSPAEWKAFADFVEQTMNEDRPGSFSDAVNKRMRLYGKSEETRLKSRDDARREVVADATRALFADPAFAEKLARHDASLADKIGHIIKDFIKTIKQVIERLIPYQNRQNEFRSLWKDIRTLEKASDMFIAATEEARQNEVVGQSEKKQYEIRHTKKGEPVVVITENILDGVPENEWRKTVKTELGNRFANGIELESGSIVGVTKITKDEYTYSKDSRRLQRESPSIFRQKMRAAGYVDEIVVAATNWINEEKQHKNSKSSKHIVDFGRGHVLIKIGKTGYEADVIVGLTKNNKLELYDVVSMKPKSIGTLRQKRSSESAMAKAKSEGSTSFEKNIPQSSDNSKQLSLSDLDSDYMAAVKAGDMKKAQEMVDEAAERAMPESILRKGRKPGKLIKMYHGSGAKDFYEFNMRDGALGVGAYFSDSFNEAAEYAIFSGQIDQDENWDYVWNGETWDRGSLEDELVEQGYIRSFYLDIRDKKDFVKHHGDIIAVARNKNQIKLADPVTYDDAGNVIPLSERFNAESDDIRYSLKDSLGRMLTPGQQEYFKNSKARDRDGRLAVVYHTTDKGGFTVFDPKRSDDKRSLFFASNFDVSQTYGRNAHNPVDLENAGFTSWESFESYAKENLPGWDANKSLAENLDAEITPNEYMPDDAKVKFEATFDNWIRQKGLRTVYDAKIKLPTQSGSSYHLFNNSPVGLLRDINDVLGLKTRQKGYYESYLNLENPLIVEGKGANWHSIPYTNNEEDEIDATYKNLEITLEWEWDEETDQQIGYMLYGQYYDKDGELHEIDSFGDSIPAIPDSEDYWDIFDDWVEQMSSAVTAHLVEQGLPKELAEQLWDPGNEDPMDGSMVLTGNFDENGNVVEEAENVPLSFSTRELAWIAEEQGYDGVIIRDIKDIGGASTLMGNALSDIYIAFNSNQVKDVRNENPTEDPDIRFSLEELDDRYMAAVRAGEMDTAQELVDEAARRAGYQYKGYHGTIDNFNVFSKELQGRNWDGDSRLGKGFYFAFDEYTAQEWTEGTRVVSAFLHMRKPLDLRREAPKDIIARIDAYIDRKIDSYDESYPISREQFVKNVRRIQEIYKNDPGTFLDQFKYDDYGEMTDGIRELLEEMGYDGIIAEDEMVVFESNQIKSADPVTYDDEGNVIPLSKRFSEESDDIRFSLEDNKGKTLTEAQQEFFRNVAPELKDEQGRLKRYYHGTGRADRVGYFFDPERATSGPMAFFTDDEEIATNYSRDKEDTSLAYEYEDVNNYYNQFVVDVDGEEVNLLDYWHYLSPQQKAEFSERAGQITRDWDNDYDSFVLEEGNTRGNGGYAHDPYTVRQARGNVFRMLEDAWLWSGDLFNEEEEFLKILDLLGVKNARYKDPNYREEKVYEVYLNITHPLVTSEIDEEFADDLEDWLDSTDLEEYMRETAAADWWDKNNWDPYEWLDKLRDDIANGTTYAWTSIPDAVTAFMKEYGDGYEPYDGIVDTGGKYHDAGHQVVIPFYSNQIKSVDNENPTENEDIRFSLESPVEQVGDLIASHNLNAEDLESAFRLGGFPVPSIAVSNIGHDKYGNISLLFHSDTIDPEKSRYNDIFGGDAYTPTFPTVDKKISSEVAVRIRNHLEKSLGIDPYQKHDQVLRGLRMPSLDVDNIRNAIQYRTPYEAYGDDPVFKLAYLREKTGTKVRVPMKEVTLGNHEEAFWKWLSERMPEYTVDDAFSSYDELLEKYEPTLREAMRTYAEKKYADLEEKPLRFLMKQYDEQMGFAPLQNNLLHLLTYREKGLPVEADVDALNEKLDKRISKKAYKKWIDELFDGIVEKEGIRNDKDMFTRAGNRRSWEALHDSVTLENVVKEMRRNLAAGASSMFGANPRGAAQKRYGSLDAVRADKGRLRSIDFEEYQKLSEDAMEKLREVTASIAEHNRRSSHEIFGAYDVGSYVAEVLNRTRSKSRMHSILEKEYSLNITDSEMDDIMDAINAIAEMPTEYFEAKPRRAIGFDEVKAAVVPKTLSRELKAELKNRGIPVITYDPNVENARIDAVNKAADEQELRFSLEDTLSEAERASLNDYVSLSPEMLNSLISEYAIPGATTNNYSKAWIATIDPRDFLRLTLPDDVLATWQNGTENAWGQEVRELDVEDLKNARQVPYLIIDTDESHSVIGHEGRHRMLALMRAGYTNIPVVIRDMSENSKRSKESMERMDLWPQDFGDGPVNGADTWVEAFDVIPIREQNRAQIEDTYGTDGKVQFSMQDSEGNELTPAQKRYFENSQARDRDGRLAVVYHSTNKGGFTIFDSVWSDDEISFFFTSNRAMSESYMRGPSNDIDPYKLTGSNVEINTVEDAINFIRNLDPDIYGPEIYHLENGKDPEEFYDVDRYIEKYGTDDPGMLIEVFDDVGYSVGEGKNWIEAAKDIQDGLRDNDPREHKNIEGTYSAYLNLKDPLIIECEGSSWNEIREPGFDSHFVSFDGEYYYIDGTTTPWDLEDLDVYGEGFKESVEIWKENSDPDFWDWGDEVFTFNGQAFDATEEGQPMSGNTRYWCEYAQDLGYDGVIFRDLYDNGAFGSGYEQGDVYVAFDSNQIKDIRNENPTDDPDIRFSFAGEDALNADNMMLQIAKNWDAEGKSSEEIRQFTGWHKGYDDKWRFEIDDSQMRLSTDKKLWKKPGAVLEDVLYHPVLFANYPQLRKVNIAFGTTKTLGQNVYGSYSRITNTLTVANKAFMDKEAESTTMHEVQHAIQRIEGFARGANTSVMRGRSIPSAIRDLAMQSARMLKPHFDKYGVNFGSTLDDVKADVPMILMQAAAENDFETIETINAFLAAMRAYEEAENNTTFGRYERAAGEIEARDVQTRLRYSESQRRATRPDIDRKDALLKNDMGQDLVEPKTSYSLDEEIDPEVLRLYEKVDELRRQMKLSKGTIMSDKDARNLARELFDMPGYMGEKKLNAMVKRIKKIYEQLAKDETMEEGLGDAMALAREIIENSIDEYGIGLTDDSEADLNSVKAWLKSAWIYLTPNDKKDISTDWGDWYRSHRKMIPHMTNDRDKGRGVDQFVEEFEEVFPGIVDHEYSNNAVDHLLQIVDWVETMEMTAEERIDRSHPYYNEMVNDVASIIFERMDQAVPAQTFADRKQAEKKAAVQREKERSKQRVEKEKDKSKERLGKQKEKSKQKLEDLRRQKKEEKDAAVERIKEHYKKRLEKLREEKNLSTEQKLRRRMQAEQERDRKRKDRQYRRKLRDRIERDAKDLSTMLLKPTEKKHIPFGYDKAIATLLNSLDFETIYTDKWIEKYGRPSRRVMDLRDLREQYAKIVASDTTEIEANQYMMMMIEALATKTENMRLSDLDTRTLSEVRTLVGAIKHQISHINQAFTENIQQTISELGDATIEYFNEMDDQTVTGGLVGRARDFVNVANAKPIDFFDRVGSPLQTVFEEIVKGEDTHIRNIQQTKKFIEDIKKKYGKHAFDTWSGEKAEAQTFDLSDGKSIELTPAQIMSLYALNKREQARGHMYASGIVVAPVSKNMKNKLKKKLLGDKLMKTHVHITYEDVIKITSSLTNAQKEVANMFLSFLNGQCAEWGNQTSMKLYGYESFREPNYFPIKSSDMFLNESTSEKGNAISKLKNTGFTKATVEFADNPIVIDDFFRVCATHINTMSMYNAFVPAITDFERVYNYNDRTGRGIESSVKQSINRKMGDAVNKYINTLLQDLNTQYNKDQNGLTIADELLRRWKSVKIGANARVLIQQPTAITRAQVYIDYKYLAQGMTANVNPKTASATKKRMWETCPIAYWKHLGFAQTDVSRDMQDIIMGNEDSMWNKMAFGMYGFADDVAWTRIFAAVEAETRAEHPEIREGSAEWKEHVNERFRYIVDRTQVVDSTLHRSQMMRNKDWYMRSLTSFMAEPTTQINMWMTMLKTARDQIKSGDKKGAAKTMTRFGQNYIVSMITLSVAASLISAMRDSWTGDDDDDLKNKPFIEKWLLHYAVDDFRSNVNLLNQLPWVKDLVSIWEGYDVQRADMSMIADALQSVKKYKEYYDKDGDVKYSWKKLMLDAVSDSAALFGVPMSNLERDFMASRKAFFNVMKDSDYAHFKEDSFELNPAKNKRTFIEYYLNELEKGNDDTADEIKTFLNDNNITDEDIDRMVNKRLSTEVDKAIEEDKPDKVKKILKKYKDNYDYSSEDVMKKVRNYYSDDLKSAIEEADADKIESIMKNQKKYGMSKDEIQENVHYWTNRYYKTALEEDDTDKMDSYDRILKSTGMSKDEIYLNRGNYYIGYYDMLIYNAPTQSRKRTLARKVARLFPDMTDEEYILNFVASTESKQNLSNWPKRKWTKASISKRRNRHS